MENLKHVYANVFNIYQYDPHEEGKITNDIGLSLFLTGQVRVTHQMLAMAACRFTRKEGDHFLLLPSLQTHWKDPHNQ